MNWVCLMTIFNFSCFILGNGLIQALRLFLNPMLYCTMYYETRGSQEPVIAHLVFNLTSKVDRKWGCYT